MTARRFVLCALAAATFLAPLRARSQSKPKRIGSLALDEGALARQDEVFKGRLRELGWIEGKNLAIEYRFAKPDQIHAMAEELVARKVDLIVVWSTVVALAAKKATTSIPIVMARVADPVGAGLVASLARPGGNITGTSAIAPELMGKRLELLKEIVPKLSRVAFLAYGGDPAHKLFAKQLLDAGRVLDVHVHTLAVKTVEEIDAAFDTIAREKSSALIVQPIFVSSLGQGRRIAELAVRARLPTISDGYAFADAGGLVYYGADRNEQYRRAAALVDRILRGANPAELPIEQPHRFELVVNMKTAKALGINIPQTILVRAERVIE
jgi:putative ABC transport system substrate-binding protein